MGDADVGKRIKARRKELGMSAEEVAAIIGVSPATVYRYESAAIMNMKTDKLLPIAEALETTPEYLMGWTDDPVNYEDGDVLASIPLSYVEACDGDMRRAYAMMQAADEEGARDAAIRWAACDSDSWAAPLVDAYEKSSPDTQRAACAVLNIVHVTPYARRKPKMTEMIVFTYPAAAGLPLYAESDYERVEFPEADVPPGADFGIRISGNSMEPTIEDGSIVWVHKQPDIRDGEVGIFMLGDSAVCKRARFNGNGRIKCLESDNPDYKPIKGADLEGLRVVGKVLL